MKNSGTDTAPIEAATLEDVAQLTELLGLLFNQEADFRPDPSRQARGLRLILESPESGLIFVLRENSEIVGMVNLLFTISTAEGARVILLEDLIVRPESRRQGLGSRLLRHAVSFAAERGYPRITLLTDRANEKAIRFYERHGFRLSEMIPMRLALDPRSSAL